MGIEDSLVFVLYVKLTASFILSLVRSRSAQEGGLGDPQGAQWGALCGRVLGSTVGRRLVDGPLMRPLGFMF